MQRIELHAYIIARFLPQDIDSAMDAHVADADMSAAMFFMAVCIVCRMLRNDLIGKVTADHLLLHILTL